MMENHSRSRNEPTKEGRKTAHWKLLESWVKEFGWTTGKLSRRRRFLYRLALDLRP